MKNHFKFPFLFLAAFLILGFTSTLQAQTTMEEFLSK